MSDYTTLDRQELIFQNEIGKGGFSTVYKVKSNTDRYISKLRLNSQFAAAKKLNRVDDIELKILSKLRHPNIVKLIGVVDALPRYYLILEICEGGSLHDYLARSINEPVNKSLAYCWLEQAARAIQFLQKNNVIHRDIKSHNFLITRSNNLKLADFGISKISDVTVTTAVKGTWAWVAPEVFTEEHLSPQSDIYSYGIVVWEIFTKMKPFEGCEYQNVMWRVCEAKERPPIPDSCPDEIAALLRQCWQEDRKARPEIGAIVRTVSEYRKTFMTTSMSPPVRQYDAYTEVIVQFAGEQNKIEILYGSRVQSVKESIAITGGYSGHLKLLYKDQELDNHSTLLDYLIDDGDIIQMLLYIRLHVVFENGDTIDLVASPEEALQDLKTRLNLVGPVYFTTTYQHPLKDENSLAYYDIKDDDSLRVVTLLSHQIFIRIQTEEGRTFTMESALNETVRDLKNKVQHQHLILREKLYSTIENFSRRRECPTLLIDRLKAAALQDEYPRLVVSGTEIGPTVCMMNLKEVDPLPHKFGWFSDRMLVTIPSLTADDIENIMKLARSDNVE